MSADAVNSSRGTSNVLDGCTALVTGATGGIGRAVSFVLASRGATVAVQSRRRDRALNLVNELNQISTSGSCGAFVADFSKPTDTQRLCEEVIAAIPQINLLVAVAGADVLTGEPAQWDFNRKLQELLAVDVTSTMQLCRGIGRHFCARGGGTILTIGWDQAETGMEGDSGELFAATKGAVMQFTKSLAKSLAPQVRVNCVAPGWIRTSWGEKASQQWQDRACRESLLERWGTPEDVAHTIAWLAGPDAVFVTGQVIAVNGGLRR